MTCSCSYVCTFINFDFVNTNSVVEHLTNVPTPERLKKRQGEYIRWKSRGAKIIWISYFTLYIPL